jgi:hypothetical protein
MDRIFDLQETTVEALETWVQAKNKTGVDQNDHIGVEQLLNMREALSPAVCPVMILTSLADDFTPKTKRLAENHNVLLINGREFAALCLQSGLIGSLF